MAKVGVNLSTDIQESVQGKPVNEQNESKINSLPKQDLKARGGEKNIMSAQTPSSIDNKNKLPVVNKDVNKNSKEDATKSKKPTRWWIWVLIAIFVLGGAAAAYFLFLKDTLL